MRQLTELIVRHGQNIGRGVLMGGADIVPGVSGGTVALILGIYERLVTAVSHFDLRLLRMLGKRQWKQAAAHVDLALLIPLGTGILLGFVIMTILMHFLLSTEGTRCLTMAMFFGLIFASGVLVALMIHTRSVGETARCMAVSGVGVVVAWWLAGLNTLDASNPHLAFVFMSGAVAICAMILPGISGAMILLILGVYIHLTEIPGNLLHAQDVLNGVVTVLVFASGCAIGLVTFSKFLHWLLERHHAVTMALLCGFMFGSLRKLWPFQRDLTPEIDKIKFKIFEPILPHSVSGQELAALAVFIVAGALVFCVDLYTHGHLRRLFGGGHDTSRSGGGR